MIVDEIARILPLVTLLLFLAGPAIMTGMLFQAIGDARRAAILTLSRTYLFALPLIFVLPFWLGEPGIWYGSIVAEILATLLSVGVLWHRAVKHNARWGAGGLGSAVDQIVGLGKAPEIVPDPRSRTVRPEMRMPYGFRLANDRDRFSGVMPRYDASRFLFQCQFHPARFTLPDVLFHQIIGQSFHRRSQLQVFGVFYGFPIAAGQFRHDRFCKIGVFFEHFPDIF